MVHTFDQISSNLTIGFSGKIVVPFSNSVESGKFPTKIKVRNISAKYDQIWSNLHKFDHVWLKVANFDQVMLKVAKFDQIGLKFSKLDLIR